MLKKILDILLKIFHILFVILTFWLLFISIFRKDLMTDFMSYLENLINILWFYNYIIALFSSIVETFPILWAIVPGQNIMLLVGWFFGKISYYNLVILIFIASIWALIWNHIWYLMWKKYWDSFFEKYWIYVWIWKTEVEYIKSWINKWWWVAITLWKFNNLTRCILPFIAGSMQMKNKKFFIYNALWSILRATSIILLWVVFANIYKFLIKYSWRISLVILVIIWIYIYFFKKEEFIKYWNAKNKEFDNL